MFSSTDSRVPSISDHLRATKGILRDVIFDARSAITLEKAEVDALERDVFEVLRLIRSWRNMVAPINKIPPEILALIPDFLDPSDGHRGVIALTHVCRAWREAFVSRSSLWVDFDCKDGDKTGIYLQRSKSSPVNLSLRRTKEIYPSDPFFRIVPLAIGRLKSLYIEATPENIQAIIAPLSHPTPLLDHLTISVNCENGRHPVLTPTLFNEDLSSLHTLHLDSIRTELPWRSMVNLTSFTLAYTPEGELSAGQLLDFFEAAPHLCEVNLRFTTPTTSVQNGRLVSLGCLKSMYIEDTNPSSVLLDHLVIPVGAKLTTRVDLRSSLIGEHLPRSLDNLKNFSDFTTIQFYLDGFYPSMKFSGPNGEVTTTSRTSRIDRMLESLTQLNTSGAERLEINRGHFRSRDSVYQALPSIKDLRVLTLSECSPLRTFIRALYLGIGLSEAMVCPKLEELILVPRADQELDIESVIEMAAARARRGWKLRTIKIVDSQGIADLDILELRKHVQNVEYDLGVGGSQIPVSLCHVPLHFLHPM